MRQIERSRQFARPSSALDDGLDVHAIMSTNPTSFVKRFVGLPNAEGPTICQIAAMKATVGRNLQRLRKERRLTQVEVAAELDVGRSTIAGIERGNDPPGRETLMKLAAFYKTTVDELYSGTVGDVPETAKLAKDDDELSLLLFWRDLDEAKKRRFLLRLVRGED